MNKIKKLLLILLLGMVLGLSACRIVFPDTNDEYNNNDSDD